MAQSTQTQKLISTLDTLIEVFSYMHQDFTASLLQNTPIYYNVDFSIMFPYLFPTNPDTASDFLVSGKEVFETLLNINDADVPFRLAFTGASFWELLDLINHHVQFWKNRSQCKVTIQDDLDSIRSKIDRKEISFDKATDILGDSGYPIRTLEAISTDGFDQHVVNPFISIQKLFRDNKIFSSLGDANLPPNTNKFYASYKYQFSKHLEGMLKGRYDRSKRSPADRAFHYSVDAANWALGDSNNIRNDVKFLYATPVKYIMDKSHGSPDVRPPLVPAYLINTRFLHKQGLFRDEEYYISRGFELALNLRKAVSAVGGDITKLPPFEIDELKKLDQYYIKTLNSPKTSQRKPGIIKSKEEILESLDLGANKLTEAAERAKNNMLETAGDVISCALNSMNDELVRSIDLQNHKIIKKIAKNLKIKL